MKGLKVPGVGLATDRVLKAAAQGFMAIQICGSHGLGMPEVVAPLRVARVVRVCVFVEAGALETPQNFRAWSVQALAAAKAALV